MFCTNGEVHPSTYSIISGVGVDAEFDGVVGCGWLNQFLFVVAFKIAGSRAA